MNRPVSNDVKKVGAFSAMIDVLTHSIADEPRAHLLLSDLLGVRDASRPLATAAALASAFADLGLPLE